jgi:Domain of unknown function (DUF397)
MDWHKSGFSVGGHCAEVAFDDDAVLVRHSRYGNPALVFSPEEWVAFIKGVKAGEFDG